MGKINKNCERRSLRGCSGCPILHTTCDKEKHKSNKKSFNYKISLEMAKEAENEFFGSLDYRSLI
jgi:hypothetical protein